MSECHSLIRFYVYISDRWILCLSVSSLQLRLFIPPSPGTRLLISNDTKETARTFHRREHHVPTLLDPIAQNRERMPKQTKQDLALTVVGVDLAETALDRLGHVRLAV